VTIATPKACLHNSECFKNNPAGLSSHPAGVEAHVYLEPLTAPLNRLPKKARLDAKLAERVSPRLQPVLIVLALRRD
jgi:hypothetical protein